MNIEIVINGIKINDLNFFFAIELLYCVMQVISLNLLKAPWLMDSELHFSIWFLVRVNPHLLQSEQEDFHNCVQLCHNSQCVNMQVDGMLRFPGSQWLLCLLNCLPAVEMLFQHLPFSWSQKYQMQRKQCCCEDC